MTADQDISRRIPGTPASLPEYVQALRKRIAACEETLAKERASSERDVEGRRILSRLKLFEQRQLRLLMAAKSNPEIGAVMGISEQSVKNRFGKIYAKTRTRNRLELALFVVAHPALRNAFCGDIDAIMLEAQNARDAAQEKKDAVPRNSR